MPDTEPLTRRAALEILRRHGIEGAQVYLIDVIPLIEMIWADGKAQESEIHIFEQYLERHVALVNEMAGYQLLALGEARAFVLRFLQERPPPELLASLRDLVVAVRLSSSDDERNAALRASLLAACLDIAASSVARYPYDHGERFDDEEKRSFFEIMDSLGGREDD